MSDDEDDERKASSLSTSGPQRWSAESWARIARVRVRVAAMRVAGRALVRRFLPNESQHLFALTLAVGVVCGLAAVAFHLSIRAAEHLVLATSLVRTRRTPPFATPLNPMPLSGSRDAARRGLEWR